MNQVTSRVGGVFGSFNSGRPRTRRLALSRLALPLLVTPLLNALACVPGASISSPPPDSFSGSGGSGAQFVGPQPSFESPISAATPPPAISGGTLAALADGRTAVAADPDRDRVFIVDYKAANILANIALNPGDEPGRVIEDGAGRVHVALRRAGAVLTITPGTWQVAARRSVCTGPRGLAFDARTDNVLVACADGDLVSLPAAPDGAVSDRRTLDRDLRDVVIVGDNVYVSRFRSAEVFVIDSSNLITRITPPVRPSFQKTFVQSSDGGGDFSGNVPMTAAVAWRMLATADGDVVLMHQRGADRPVSVEHGGYGGFACGGIVETTISHIHPTDALSPSPAFEGVTLAVDMAISPDGKYIVMAVPGNAREELNGLSQVSMVETSMTTNANGMNGDCVFPRPGMPRHHDDDMTAGTGGATGNDGGTPASDGGTGIDAVVPGSGGSSGMFGSGGLSGTNVAVDVDYPFPSPGGEVTAVAFDKAGILLAQTREPATLQILNAAGTKVVLSTDSRLDTGHAIFHSNSGAGLACASCHPEGGDDGRVWTFAGKDGAGEPRRTQNLRGGVLATAPFHWDGTLGTVEKLMTEVFVGRMAGPTLSAAHIGTLSHWVDGIPAMPALAVADKAATQRGSAVFQSAGCATCHIGTLLTDNKTQNVGTGMPAQTPSLRGLVWRAPYMHTGCAKTLDDRFSPTCGGGDSHGSTSGLSTNQRADLVAYLETL